MARLMVIPYRDRDNAVLIVTRDGDATVMGYVTISILSARLKHPLSACEGLAIVERHLPAFEKILFGKSSEMAFANASIACVELDAADLDDIGVAEWHRT